MDKPKVQEDAFQRDGVSLTPLAIPMLAGPGSISFLIGLYQEYEAWNDKLIAIFAIFSVCLATFLVLRSSHYIVSMLGASGINAISRIIGFIVIAIGVEYISSSVMNLLGSLFN
jgi:multiple antibiotic resistance protein